MAQLQIALITDSIASWLNDWYRTMEAVLINGSIASNINKQRYCKRDNQYRSILTERNGEGGQSEAE